MSHFNVLVIGENPEEQLQPYHEYESTGILDKYVKFVEAELEPEETLIKLYEEVREEYNYNSFFEFMKNYKGYEQKEGKWGRYTNPNTKWDWYVLGGRWKGYFKLKGNNDWVDQAIIRYVDFEGMKEKAKNKANDFYERVERACSGTIPKLEKSWKDCQKFFNCIDEARSFYHQQESVAYFNESINKDENIGFFTNIEDFQITKEEYIKNAELFSIPTFAVVKDSEWFEKGSMGWFGCVFEEKEKTNWRDEFNKLIENLPGDTLLSLYDCHI